MNNYYQFNRNWSCVVLQAEGWFMLRKKFNQTYQLVISKQKIDSCYIKKVFVLTFFWN